VKLISGLLLFCSCLQAQGLDPALIAKPTADMWPTYNGDYSGRRYSPLKQINAGNIKSLTLGWAFESDSAAIKSTPLLVDGILYLTVPDNVWAIDARTGRHIWHYQYPPNQGDHIGQRGVGMYKEWLYFETPDAHLVCLSAKNGKVRWNIQLADDKLGYFATMAPLVVRDHVIVGVSGDVTDIPGFLESIDPETGKVQWRFYTEPKKGEPGAETWPKTGDAIEHGGGMTWMTGTYDPETNLVYWGTGNPNPVLVGEGRPGDNLYTCSIVAVNADSGKLAWYFQPSPHDVHDWDAVETPVLFNGEFKGVQRKLLAQASRNGYFFVLDRTNGEHLLTSPFVETNWSAGIDEQGRPVRKIEKDPTPDGALVEPSSNGSTNWMAPSFDPLTGMFYVIARRTWGEFYKTAEGKAEGWGGRDRILHADSVLQAIDYQTGKIRWGHELGEGEAATGILTTAGNILVTGDVPGNLLVLDPVTGKTLWHFAANRKMVSCPMTYQLDSVQYILTAIGDIIYAWRLPEA
jgi:alcohol dehydrogenase (cytochrome c)